MCHATAEKHYVIRISETYNQFRTLLKVAQFSVQSTLQRQNFPKGEPFENKQGTKSEKIYTYNHS